MGKIVPVLMHVDRTAKAEAEKILAAYNITLSEAFDLFLRQIVAEEGIPFDTELQDMVSVEAMDSILFGSDPDQAVHGSDKTPGWYSPLYMPLSSGSTVQDQNASGSNAESGDGLPGVHT